MLIELQERQSETMATVEVKLKQDRATLVAKESEIIQQSEEIRRLRSELDHQMSLTEKVTLRTFLFYLRRFPVCHSNAALLQVQEDNRRLKSDIARLIDEQLDAMRTTEHEVDELRRTHEQHLHDLREAHARELAESIKQATTELERRHNAAYSALHRKCMVELARIRDECHTAPSSSSSSLSSARAARSPLHLTPNGSDVKRTTPTRLRPLLSFVDGSRIDTSSSREDLFSIESFDERW